MFLYDSMSIIMYILCIVYFCVCICHYIILYLWHVLIDYGTPDSITSLFDLTKLITQLIEQGTSAI